MSLVLAIQIAVGLIAAVPGVVLLVRSSRRPAARAYGLRIAGMMLTMFGVVVAGFATIVATAHIV